MLLPSCVPSMQQDRYGQQYRACDPVEQCADSPHSHSKDKRRSRENSKNIVSTQNTKAHSPGSRRRLPAGWQKRRSLKGGAGQGRV